MWELLILLGCNFAEGAVCGSPTLPARIFRLYLLTSPKVACPRCVYLYDSIIERPNGSWENDHIKLILGLLFAHRCGFFHYFLTGYFL